jgi:hypothetical protein
MEGCLGLIADDMIVGMKVVGPLFGCISLLG